jgi:hypothetical protein
MPEWIHVIWAVPLLTFVTALAAGAAIKLMERFGDIIDYRWRAIKAEEKQQSMQIRIKFLEDEISKMDRT